MAQIFFSLSGRQTEEGFSIFKEAELGINVEAGGTPLCPFDCDCCKRFWE
jgi:hypothetical protein